MSALLAGCSSQGSNSVALDSIQTLVSRDGPGITRDYVEQLPYASILTTAERNRALLVLVRDDGALHYRSANGKLLTLSNGRLIKTAGFDTNLVGTTNHRRDPVQIGLHRVPRDYVFRRAVDLMPEHRFNLAAISSFRKRGMERVEILDKTFNLLRVDENLQIPALGFRTTNIFWVEPDTGFVRKSRQTISPEAPSLEIAVTKPYGGGGS